MQNEELSQEGHDKSRKTMCPERGKIGIIFGRGGMIIVLGPKYRPQQKRRLLQMLVQIGQNTPREGGYHILSPVMRKY